MKTTLIAAVAALSVSVCPVAARTASVTSPDGTIVVTVADDDAAPAYKVVVDGRTVLDPAQFAIDIAGM
ncbi:MAG: hypothetical protein K2G21_04720, partial [Muribaculaceae bacterium]|nr:hypothetical protein [Muribaculaceae bacterium]